MTLYQECLKEQNLNQRLGRDASFNYALCAVMQRKLEALTNKSHDPE